MLIGLAGYAQSGKDTVAGILVERHGFTRVAFADTLKQVAYEIDPLVDYFDWTERLTEVVDRYGWDEAKQFPHVRAILQRLGVAVRNNLGETTWIDAAMRKAARHEHVVISDVRFRNEADAIKAAGGEMWRIKRPGVEAVNGHISEHDLQGYTRYDRIVNNDSTIHDLAETVASYLRGVKADQLLARL